jgi:hypothetical protein
METSDWPPSNYPIFLALVLLFATAVTLAMGDEPLAEDLAIYAYYLLVIGVSIRFFELALPDDTPDKLKRIAKSGLDLADKTSQWARGHVPDNMLPLTSNKLLRTGSRFISGMRSRLDINMSYIIHIADISKDVAIYLSVIFVIMFVYGILFDWWTVSRFLPELAVIILGFAVLHLTSRIIIKKSHTI